MTNLLKKYGGNSSSNSTNLLKKYRNESNESNQDEEEFYNQHPIIKGIGQLLTKIPGLNKAGDIAEEYINKPVEHFGFPHAARGVFEGGENVIRGVGNLIPGVNIPKSKISELPIGQNYNKENENILQKIMGMAGQGLSEFIPATKAAKIGQKTLEHINIPNSLKNILIGGGVGATLSPDDRKLGGALGATIPIAGETVKKLASKVHSHLPEYLQHPIKSAKGTFNLPKKIRELAEKEQSHSLIKEEENSLKQQYGNQKFGTLKNKASELEQKANLEQNKATNIQKEEIPLSNALPSATGEGLEQSSEKLLKTAEQKAMEKENQLSSHLMEGKTHEIHVGQFVHKKQKELVEANKQKWNELGQKLDEHEITIAPKGKKELDDQLKNLVQTIQTKGEKLSYSSPEFTKILEEFEALGKEKKIPASKYLDLYRDVRDEPYRLRKMASKVESAEERTKLFEKADKVEQQAPKMLKILHDSIGSDNQKLLTDVSNEYRDKIAPLFDNPIYKEIKKTGKITGNIISKLSTGESGAIHPGNELIKNIIKSDPKMIRHVIGASYAENPKVLHQYDEALQEYLQHNEMKPLRNFLQEHQSALYDIELAQEHVNSTKNKIEELKTTSDRVNKSWNELKSKQMTREKALENADRYRKEARNLKETAKILEEASNKTGLSLKEKLEAKKQAAQAKEDAINFTKFLGTITLLYGGKKGLNKLTQ